MEIAAYQETLETVTEVRTFSPWCQMCLDGEDRGRIDAHELHVLRLKRERAAQISKLPWRWQQVDTVKPLPRGSGQGPELALTPLVEHEPGGYQQADQ